MAKDYTDILLEDLNGKFDQMLEVMGSMRDEIKGMARQEDLEEVKQDVKVIKAAVTDTSHQVHDHSKRITKLEAKLV